jgi:hypothetical protein
MQPFDRNIHKLFSIETLMQTNTSSKNYNIHIMKTTHTNTPRYMYANASPLGSGPKSRVLDSREELLAQEIESLTQITEEPQGQVTESLTHIWVLDSSIRVPDSSCRALGSSIPQDCVTMHQCTMLQNSL